MLVSEYWHNPPMQRRTTLHSAPGRTSTALLWAHGGCFCDGDERWDGKLLATLALRAGVDVVAIDFRCGPEHPWPAGVLDLVHEYNRLQKSYARVYLGGTSSGGWFAFAAARRVRAPKCALLCPVLEPVLRHLTVDDTKRRKQLAYFESTDNMEIFTKHELRPSPPPPSTLIVRGEQDDDAPAPVAMPRWLTRNVREHVVAGGTHAMCKEPPAEALAELVRFITTEQ